MEFVNVVVFTLLFLLVWRKCRHLYPLYVVGIWLFSSLVGILYVQSDLYRDGIDKTTIMPFIFLAFCLLISLFLFVIQKYDVKAIIFPEKIVKYYIIVMSIMAIMPLCEISFGIIKLIADGQFLMLGAMKDDVATDNADALIKVSGISDSFLWRLNATKIVNMVVLFYCLQRRNINIRYIICIFIVSLLPALNSLRFGSRTDFIFFALAAFGMYLYLKDCFDKERKIIIKRTGIIFSSVLLAIMIAISIGRYVVGQQMGKSDVGDFLYQYTAESIYNFNDNIYNEKGTAGGLDTMFPVYQDLGLVSDNVERREILGTKIKGATHIFYSYIGDLCIDWGKGATVLILLFLAFSIRFFNRKAEISLSAMCILALYMYLISNGLFYFCYKGGWKPITWTIIIAIIAFFVERKYKEKI